MSDFHSIIVNRQGSDVPSDERYQRVATFTENQLGEALDSAGRIADSFVRLLNAIPTAYSLGEAKIYHESIRTWLIRTDEGRKIAYIHVTTDQNDEADDEDTRPVCEDCGESSYDLVGRDQHHGDLLCDECAYNRDVEYPYPHHNNQKDA